MAAMRRIVAFGFAITLLLTSAAPAATDLSSQGRGAEAQIYLFRGLANVFSAGMDEIAGKLRGHGFSPRVMNWRSERSATRSIVEAYRANPHKPIVLIGHSLGGNAVLRMAKSLNAKRIGA